MSMVSHLHHLFHPETCQSYIHMLRWTLLLDSGVVTYEDGVY
jgi:hypothetical protein